MSRSGTRDASEPRPAATLVLLRAACDSIDVLVTVRPRHLCFMGGATVFPGGAVAPADRDPRWEVASTLSQEAAPSALGEEASLGPYVCALREAFEEVGFLVGEGPLEKLKRTDADDPDTFLQRCLDLGVKLATDRLVPAGRWVTPLGAPVRFDARFFLARADAAWEPSPDPREVEECRWVSPAQLLTEQAAGRVLMAPPTIEMLQRLDGHRSVTEALEGIRGRLLDGPGDVLATRLSPLVALVLAPNPGVMTGPGTNTYVVGAGPTVVIDPAVEDDDYLDVVVEQAGAVDSILVTHRHSDHVGGARALAATTGAPVRAFGADAAGEAPVEPLADGDVIEVPGARLVALHTPGHASDHLCYLFDGAASLFSGDNVLGEGTAVIAPPDGDMRAYLDSLKRLVRLHIDRIYPGHFRPLDGGRAVIESYLAHRAERARKVVVALETLGRASVEDVVAEAYRDTPVALHPVAMYSALAHLEMMEQEGKVQRSGVRWELSGTRPG